MFENIIEFSAEEKYLKIKEDYPKPIKVNVPEWFKKLEHSSENKTVKGCIPFLQTLTTGYLLSLPQDFHLINNMYEPDKDRSVSSFKAANLTHDLNLNVDQNNDNHPTEQLKGSPLVKKNNNFAVHKIINPWKIKTPKGYSCLFLPPMNNTDDRFSIISGIVDTDSFNMTVNFPFIVNSDKYPVLDTILEKGTPYVQVIPFKRESWKMKISKMKEHNFSFSIFNTKIIHNYRKLYWNNKTKWI